MEQINKNSVVPLYHQLMEIIKKQIEDRIYKPHEQIPSEHALQFHYGISRATVRKAIDGLVKDGLLYRLHGKGTFVSPPQDQQKVVLDGFTSNVRAKGFEPFTKVLEQTVIHNVPLDLMQKLGLEPGGKTIHIKRLRFLDGEPILIAHSFIPYDLCPGLVTTDLTGSLYMTLVNEFNIRPDWSEDFIEPKILSEEDAVLLQTEPGSPVLFIERLTYTKDNDLVEVCHSFIRGDKSKFYLKHIS